MLITLGFLALLFIVGLITTYHKLPTKNKLSSWFQSLFLKANPPSCTDQVIQNKVFSSSSTSGGAAAAAAAGHNMAELRSVFATFDKNKDGFITKKELRESLTNIGISMDEGEVADMVEKVDSNGDGLIDLDEFCQLFDSIVGSGAEEVLNNIQEDGEGNLKEAFGVFDGDGDGLISVEELQLVLSSLGFKEGKKLEDCKEMIGKVDMDGDGMVNFDEFKKMMRSSTRLVPLSVQ